MKILVATNMYPIKKDPINGIFIKENIDIMKDKYKVNFKVIDGRVREQKKIYKIILYFIFSYKLLKELIVSNYDLIHAHYLFPTGFLASLISLITNKKLVITLHGCDVNDLYYGNASKGRSILSRIALNIASQIVTVSNDLKLKVIDLYNIEKNKIKVINMGVDKNIFYRISTKNARKTLKLSHSDKIILFVVCNISISIY